MTAADGKQRRRKLSAEERVLWGQVTRAVDQLRRGSASVAAMKAAPSPAGARTSSPADVPVLPGAAPPQRKTEPRLQPLGRRERQRLARGTEAIDARIDLHGRTQSEAHAALLRFLRRAQSNDNRFVLVITGKGAAGDRAARGVLKRQVPLWLKLPEFRPYVIGFETAHFTHGGDGALYVRVRRARAGR
jgi:DNA-nicking Smr family endonuclease